MDLRPRWSLHYQTTLLTVFLTVAAVLLVSWLTDKRGKETLYEHEVVDLRDDTNLRALEIQQEVIDLGRTMRSVSNKLRDELTASVQPAIVTAENLPAIVARPRFKEWWAKAIPDTIVVKRQPEGEPAGRHFDGSAIERIILFSPSGKPLVEGRADDKGIGDLRHSDTAPGGEPVEKLVEYLNNPKTEAHSVVDATSLLLEPEGPHPVCRQYFARRVYFRDAENRVDLDKPPAVLVIGVNYTTYLTAIARRAPRHSYFLLDSEGTYLHHPDPGKVGGSAPRNEDDPFGKFRKAAWNKSPDAEDVLTRSRGDVMPSDISDTDGTALPHVRYQHIKKRLPPAHASDHDKRVNACKEFNKAMAEFAQKPIGEGGAGKGLRYTELSADSGRIEISHPTKEGLERAKKKVDSLLTPADWPPARTTAKEWVLNRFGAPGYGWYPELECERFVAQLTLLNLGIGNPLSGTTAQPRKHPQAVGGYDPPTGTPRFVSAAAVVEIKQDGEIATIPAMNLIATLVCIGSAVLAFMLSRYVTKPLGQIGEAAHTLADGAKQIAEMETDPNKSGKRFAVDLPTAGPKEVLKVATAFQEMVGQLERMTTSIRRRNAEVETILRTASDGIVIFTERGEIDIANAAAEMMFGYGPNELGGVRIQKLMRLQTAEVFRTARATTDSHRSVSPDSLTDSKKSVERMTRQSGVEFRAIRKDGTEFWAEAAFNEVPLGDRVLFTGFVRDITERKEAEQRIKQLNEELDARVQLRTAELEETMKGLQAALERAQVAARAKNTFVANMNHELRQPLNTVIGYAEAIREEAVDDGNDPLVTDLDKILTAARHLLGLINDILDMSKVEDGKLELTVREFDVGGLIKDLRTMAEPLSKKNSNTLVFPDTGSLGKMTGDELRVRQMLLNLVSNACKFTTNGTVTVAVDRERTTDGEFLRFAVRDTGSGMTKEQCRRLFQRFYQVDDSTKRKQGGTGLGLAITKMLAELMGGDIGVTSEPGVGSEFFFRVPVHPLQNAPVKPARGADALVKSATETPCEQPAPRQRTVLVIDDDNSTRDLMRRFLERDGFAVIDAATGEEGLARAKSHRPDLITLDVMMPGVDGWATLAALKTDATTCNIPVVMITMVDDSGRGFALGATDYLTKPVDWQRLGATLKRYTPNPSDGPVLVVDDNENHVELVSRLLTKDGREVMTAANGQEALARLDEKRPSLILLDLMMPVMDGFDFLDALHKRHIQPPIPVIVVTAKDLNSDDIKRLNGGVAQVVQKGTPQSLEEVLHRIRLGDVNGEEVPRA